MKLETILIVFASLIIGVTAGHFHGAFMILRDHADFQAWKIEEMKLNTDIEPGSVVRK